MDTVTVMVMVMVTVTAITAITAIMAITVTGDIIICIGDAAITVGGSPLPLLGLGSRDDPAVRTLMITVPAGLRISKPPRSAPVNMRGMASD